MLNYLLALTWSEMDTIVGDGTGRLIGSDLFLGGTLFALLFLLFTFKLGVGLEAGIIFGTIFVVWMTGLSLGVNSVLSAGIATALGIVLGLILLLSLKNVGR